MNMEIRHAEIVQQNAAVGVWIGTHPTVALRSQFGQFRFESSILIE